MREKRILIVDDSEIDRAVLESILSGDFEVIEQENGYSALELIIKKKKQVDAILLDVSMPVLDGFDVLRIMQENKINSIPVFLITAEATKENVERAVQYNVAGFIKKPFERDEILRRIETKLGTSSGRVLSEEELAETNKFIDKLAYVYRIYLRNFRKDEGHYDRVRRLMEILLKRYVEEWKSLKLSEGQMDIVCKAAFFHDIGFMLLPSNYKNVTKEDMEDATYQSHTTLGANIIDLSDARRCSFFYQVCTDICIHHHERYDGKGFPHRISGGNSTVFPDMCGLAEKFDTMFSKYREHTEGQFEVTVAEIEKDRGAVKQELLRLLSECKKEILTYYENIG